MTIYNKRLMLEKLEPEEKKFIEDMVSSFNNVIRMDRKLTCQLSANTKAEITIIGREFDKKTIHRISRFLRTLADNFEDEPSPLLSLDDKCQE
jgi:hypothetical protein